MFWPKRSSLTSSRLPFAVTTVAFCLRSPLNLSRGSRLCLGHLLSIDFRYVFVSLLKLPYLNAGETVHIYIFFRFIIECLDCTGFIIDVSSVPVLLATNVAG